MTQTADACEFEVDLADMDVPDSKADAKHEPDLTDRAELIDATDEMKAEVCMRRAHTLAIVVPALA